MANSKDNISKYATGIINFDEVNGDVNDVIGGYIGTIYNNPARVTGWNGQGCAMSFNGTSQYIAFNNPMIPLGDKTIKFMLYVDSTKTGTHRILGTAHEGSSERGYYISIFDNELGVVYCNSKVVLQVNAPIIKDKWVEVIIEYSKSEGLLRLYLDRTLISENALVESASAFTRNLSIGALSTNLTAGYFKGMIDQFEIYNRVGISFVNDKYLVFHNNEYKYHDGTTWQVTTATEENFILYGMEQLSQITESQWQELSGDISIVMWTDFEDKQYMNVVLERDSFTAKDVIGDEYDILVLNSEHVDTQQLSLDAVSHPQTTYPNGDIPLFGIEELKSVNITATGNGRIAISVDSGVTWNKLNGTTWEAITDIADGMTFVEFNALTGEQLQELKGDSNTIRFAYYLTGDTEVDRIELRISMAGTPEFANKDDYDMSYDATTKTITYDIKKDGHYIVNYTNT